MNLKQITLFHLMEKNILDENEGKILNALFEKGKMDYFEIQQYTGVDGEELLKSIKSLEKKKALKETRGIFSSDFFETMENLLKEKETITVKI